VLLTLAGKQTSGCGCVVVGNRGSDRGCAGACLFLGLVGWEGRGDWWRSGRGLRGRGGRRGGRVVVEAFVVVVVAAVRIGVEGVVVAIVD
jgi:hypothetical protein